MGLHVFFFKWVHHFFSINYLLVNIISYCFSYVLLLFYSLLLLWLFTLLLKIFCCLFHQPWFINHFITMFSIFWGIFSCNSCQVARFLWPTPLYFSHLTNLFHQYQLLFLCDFFYLFLFLYQPYLCPIFPYIYHI